MTYGPKPIPLVERFWPKVKKSGENECWQWTAALDSKGYGRIWDRERRRLVGAHRVSWEYANGSLSDDICVLHRCDNPKCVNPAHLFIGTHLDNIRDMWAKGRARKGGAVGVRNCKAKLTEDNVRWVRERVAAGVPRRFLAKSLGCSSALVDQIVRGVIWRHLLEAH